MKSVFIAISLLSLATFARGYGNYDREGDGSSESTDETTPKPGFMAVMSRHSNIQLGSNQVVKFEKVLTNVGSGYSKYTGIFTAPQDGEYQFAASFITSSYKRTIRINLIKNDKIICKAHGIKYIPHLTGTLQAFLQLKKGDKVFLRNGKLPSYMFGGLYTMFSGHMV